MIFVDLRITSILPHLLDPFSCPYVQTIHDRGEYSRSIKPTPKPHYDADILRPGLILAVSLTENSGLASHNLTEPDQKNREPEQGCHQALICILK